MRDHRRYMMLTPAIILLVTFATPTVEAGGDVAMHLGSGGFGVSVGFGDWGIYTRSWSDPYWSIDFNTTLAGYGQWVWVSGLGRVWQPWVAASWRPYTHGRWVSTDWGLTWVAYEPWGYVPHHYGSWAYASFGWVWVPGYSYFCANVVWVGSGRHVGWYARPPSGWSHAQHGFRHGYRHGFRDGYDNGYNDGWRDARYATYVDWTHFGSDNVSRHAVAHSIASQNGIESRTGAPSRSEIRQRGGATITETRLSRRSLRVDGREITIARPEGVAPSIERYAAETVGRSLSEEALERRQPHVRPATANAPSASSSRRSASLSHNTRSSQTQRSTQESSTFRSDRPEISSPPNPVQRSASVPAVTRTKTRKSEPTSDAHQDRNANLNERPRRNGDFEVPDTSRSSSPTAASARKRSTAADQGTAQQFQQASGSNRSSLRSERSLLPSQRGASESRRSQPRDDRTATESNKREFGKKRSENPSRRR